MRKQFVIFLSIFLFPVLVSAQSNWIIQNPIYYSNYSDISFQNLQTGFISGDRFVILKTTNSGVNWELKNNGITGNTDFAKPFKLCMLNAQTGFASNGSLFYTTDGGDNWQLKYSDSLFTFNFITSEIGYAVKNGNKQKIYKSLDGGINWSSLYSFASNTQEVKFINSLTGFVSTNPQCYKTTDGGISFFPVFAAELLKQIYFADDNTGYGLGAYEIYRTTNSGNNWQSIKHSSSPVNYLTIQSLGYINYSHYAATNSSALKRSFNNGVSWNDFNLPLQGPHCFIDSSTGFQIDNCGKISKTIDGGVSFNALNSNFNMSEDLIKVQMFYPHTVYAISNANKILISSNGGSNWNKIIAGETIDKFLGGNFINSGVGFLHTRNSILKSTNAGINWSVHYSFGEVNARIIEMNFKNENTGFVYMVYYSDGGGIAPPGNILALKKTTNGGLTWSNLYSERAAASTFINFDFVSETLIFCIEHYVQGTSHSTNVMRSTTSGSSWVNIFGGSYPSSYITDINFVNNNTGYLSSYPGIFKTTNKGSNWSQISIFFADKIKFINDTVGYAATSDSNFYYTTNGGVNWSVSLPKVFVNDFTLSEFENGYLVGNGGLIARIGAGTVGIENPNSVFINNYSLSQNYPNPFNPVTKINFSLPKSGLVQLKIFDMLGREVQTLLNEFKTIGEHSVDFNGSNLSSGVYFYKLTTNEFVETKKMILVK